MAPAKQMTAKPYLVAVLAHREICVESWLQEVQIETILDLFAHYMDKAAIWKYLVLYFGDPLGSCYAPTNRCVAYDLGITKEEWGSLEMYWDKFRGYVQFSTSQEAVALPEVISCAKGVQPLVYGHRHLLECTAWKSGQQHRMFVGQS